MFIPDDHVQMMLKALKDESGICSNVHDNFRHQKGKIVLLVAVATATTIRSNTQHFKFYFSVLIKEKERENSV